jgi:hypothetical protein
MSTLQKNLFSAQATNANGTAIRWRGGKGRFWASGNFGSGTVKLQWSLDNDAAGTWHEANADGTALSLTAAGNKETPEIPSGWVRAVLSGATAPALDAGIVPM